jgi:hypothetical protein
MNLSANCLQHVPSQNDLTMWRKRNRIQFEEEGKLERISKQTSIPTLNGMARWECTYWYYLLQAHEQSMLFQQLLPLGIQLHTPSNKEFNEHLITTCFFSSTCYFVTPSGTVKWALLLQQKERTGRLRQKSRMILGLQR